MTPYSHILLQYCNNNILTQASSRGGLYKNSILEKCESNNLPLLGLNSSQAGSKGYVSKVTQCKGISHGDSGGPLIVQENGR